MNEESAEPEKSTRPGGRKVLLGFYVANCALCMVFLLLVVGGVLTGSLPATYIGLLGVLLCVSFLGFLIRPDVTCMGLGGAAIFAAGLFAWLEFDVASWSPHHSLSKSFLTHCGLGAITGVGLIIAGVVFWCRRRKASKP